MRRSTLRSSKTFFFTSSSPTLSLFSHDSQLLFDLSLQLQEQKSVGMEVLCHHSPYCLQLDLGIERAATCSLKHHIVRRLGPVCVSNSRSLRIPDRSYKLSSNCHGTELTSLRPRRFRVAQPKAFTDSYVVGDEDGLTDISRTADAVPKITIPPLPGESNGERSAPISSRFWEWKPKLYVHYEKSGFSNTKAPPVLFLPGFGVGSFHYEKQLKDLGRDYRVWALDFLGQGMSLPMEDPTLSSKVESMSEAKNRPWGFGDETEPWAEELVYSVDLWKEQVQSFIEQVIGEPVYIVGNSLGGFVALYFAAYNPELVRGVTLLNATPFWGFLPNPDKSPLLSKLFPWAGTFPLPSNVKKLTESVWQKITQPESIADVLRQVYADHTTNVDKVFSRILETTEHPAAAASLASIMFAPRPQLSFSESLSRCRENKVPICLMYGKEDPWVTPLWGHQVKKQVPGAPYYELSPAGHCPHDEVPEVW
ncbi:Pheophytinase, chloroplastic-like protein, partial [Drosera capensis]